MTLPTHSSQGKTALLLIALSGSAGPGCATSTAQASFPARPDTVVAGDLRGPFDGQVLDAASGKPIEGAAVLASWGWDSAVGLTGPAGSTWQLVETNADGRYRLPRVDEPADARGRLQRATLVIYKRGYVAWRSDRRWDDFSSRGDFAQYGNTLRLDRSGADFSYARHLRYIGVGGPLLDRLSWEAQQAAIEETARATASRAPAGEEVTGASGEALDARQLLTAADVLAVTAWQGTFTAGRLGDLPSSEYYDSLHLRADSGGERFDVALRIFHVDAAKAEQQYEVLRGELPEVKETNELGPPGSSRSLRAREGEVWAVAAVERVRGIVLLLTCGAGQCRDHEMAVAIVRRVWGRLGRYTTLAPRAAEPAEPAEPASAEPSPTEPTSDRPFQLTPPRFRK